MNRLPRAAIDGRPVPFPDGGALQWRFVFGFGAPIQSWELPAPLVDEILGEKLGQEVTLELDGAPVERVLVLGDAPSGNPLTKLLVLTDVRWYWSRGWLVRDANVRRRVGDRRLVGGDLVSGVVVDEVRYAPWSIDGRVAFTWERLARNVLGEATAARLGRPSITYVIDPGSFGVDDRIVEETLTDDALPAGLARAVASLPGRDLWVDAKGVVRVADRAPGAERGLVEGLPKPLRDHGDLRLVTLAASRPSSYRVLFTREHEVKFVFDPQATVTEDDPFLENVVQVPNRELSIPAVGRRAARTVGQGSYVTHQEYYRAIGRPTLTDAPPELTDDVVRGHFLGPWLEANYVLGFGLTSPDPFWSKAIGAVKGSYRTLFRVNPRFWSHVLSASLQRAAVWDVETGTRAPSPVYANHARKYSTRTLAAGVTKLGHNVLDSYAANLADAKIAPADPHAFDLEQGVLAVVWRPDPWDEASAIAPSAVEEEPDLDPEVSALLTSFTWPTRVLVARHQVALVLSCVPAGPNDDRRLFSLDVSLADAEAALKLSGLAGIEGKGPVQVLRVRSRTARFAWSDQQDQRDAILSVFGVAQADPSLLVPVNLEDELLPLARAFAAADLAQRLDHYQGTLKVPACRGDLGPVGSIGEVVLQVGRGEASTILRAAPPQPTLDPYALLPPAARRILGREVSA